MKTSNELSSSGRGHCRSPNNTFTTIKEFLWFLQLSTTFKNAYIYLYIIFLLYNARYSGLQVRLKGSRFCWFWSFLSGFFGLCLLRTNRSTQRVLLYFIHSKRKIIKKRYIHYLLKTRRECLTVCIHKESVEGRAPAESARGSSMKNSGRRGKRFLRSRKNGRRSNI